jgi:acyl carrier protein
VRDIAQRLIEIVAAKFALHEFDLALDTTYVGDLAANSIDAIELVMLIEEEFGVDISDKDAAEMITLRDTIAYLSSAARARPRQTGNSESGDHR